MFNLEKAGSGVFLILISGILILGMGFIFMSCGKDPQWKVADSDKGQFAVDFSLAPADKSGNGSGVNSNFPSIEGKELTIEAWVKSRSDDLNGGIFGRMDAKGIALYVKDNEPKMVVRRWPIAGGEMRCDQLSPTSTECIVGSGFQLPKDVWTHIAGVLTMEDHGSGPNDCVNVGSEKPHLAIYINGELRNCATTESLSAINVSVTDYLTIGYVQARFCETPEELCPPDKEHFLDNNTIKDTTRFNGVIDEVRFWWVARTQAQIQACMGQELSFDKPGDCYVDPSILIGYWRLNEEEGDHIFDISGMGSSGILESSGEAWDTGWVEGAPIVKD